MPDQKHISFSTLLMTIGLFMVVNTVTFATSPSIVDDYWKCATTDGEFKEWVAQHPKERYAANLAYDACKKQSRFPKTCKASKEACELFVQGVSTKPMWQCTALDQQAKPWVSNLYGNRDDAALAAKAYCQENSDLPGSCYINLITCKNRAAN